MRVDVPWSPHISYHPVVQLLLAGVALLGGAASVATRRRFGRPGRLVVLGSLALAISVFTANMATLPGHLVMLAALSIDSVTGLAHVLLSAVGTVLLASVAIAYGRRLRGRCPRCGGSHAGGYRGRLTHPAASVAAGRTRIRVYLLMSGLLPWAAVKTIWTLGGDALGVTAEGWRSAGAGASAPVRALAAAGVDVTVLAGLGGVFLLLGLMYPWGQVFPRWSTPILSGRRVPRLLPLLPAWMCAVGLAGYGVLLLLYASLVSVTVLPAPPPEAPFTTSSGNIWMIAFGGLGFGGLGFALILAARSYAERTRPICSEESAGFRTVK
ncbi:hypothetical protein AB0J74_20550 [Asanoa sp. NPDC049573]|uniref:hypothetical protein n=1 Tax=Asanoa sp. NPDC049573 TaxID=3155396 RepID=UPI0034250FF4